MLQPRRDDRHSLASIALSDTGPAQMLADQLIWLGIDPFSLPARLQSELQSLVQTRSNTTGGDLSFKQAKRMLEREYLSARPYVYVAHELSSPDGGGLYHLRLRMKYQGQGALIDGGGISAIDSLRDALGLDFALLSPEPHSINLPNAARAIAVVEIKVANGATLFGVGVHMNTDAASLIAVLSAVNRALRGELLDDWMLPATSAIRRPATGLATSENAGDS
jgi:2-isopropylmalate synthase